MELLSKIRADIPSLTLKKELTKDMVDTILSQKTSAETIAKIKKEIDDAPVIVVNADKIIADFEAGLVSTKTASIASGYGEDEWEQAQADKQKRLNDLLASQAAFGRKGIDNASQQDNLGARGAASSPEDKTNAKDEKKVNVTVKGK